MYIKVEKQVCSLALSKNLKDLKVKQESLWYWIKPYMHENSWTLTSALDELNISGWKDDEPDCIVSAYTVAELGDLLPRFLNRCNFKYDFVTTRVNRNSEIEWSVRYEYKESFIQQVDCSEANARAKMLVMLIEEGNYCNVY